MCHREPGRQRLIIHERKVTVDVDQCVWQMHVGVHDADYVEERQVVVDVAGGEAAPCVVRFHVLGLEFCLHRSRGGFCVKDYT